MTDNKRAGGLGLRPERAFADPTPSAGFVKEFADRAELIEELGREQRAKAALGASLDRERSARAVAVLAAEQARQKHSEVTARLLWNVANYETFLSARTRRYALLKTLLLEITFFYLYCLRFMPEYRKTLAAVRRHFGRDGLELVYRCEFRGLTPAGARSISSDPFWRYVITPIEKNESHRGLFDSEYYFSCYPDVRREGRALRHYLLFGAGEGRNPHPLFDTAWYLGQNPDVAASGLNPLFHFAAWGGTERRSPHPLFHSAWYLQQYPDVAAAGVNPLFDYMSVGADNGRDPNPFFDSDWYLAQYPEVAAAGTNPLADYLTSGAARGRDPNPFFDSDWYLRKYPEAAEGMNPLVHYLLVGATEGRAPLPHPEASSRHRLQKAGPTGGTRSGQTQTWAPPSLSPPRTGAVFQFRDFSPAVSAPTLGGRPLIVCVSHIFPWPPRAGNEYRLSRVLSWLAGQGYEILLIIAPLGKDASHPERDSSIFSKYPNVILCYPDGIVFLSLRSTAVSFSALNGRHSSQLLSQDHLSKDQSSRLERSFCHDALVALLVHVSNALPNAIYYINYAFMTRFVNYSSRRIISIVDTIDIFSQKKRNVMDYGVVENIAISEADERRMLVTADAIVAIHDKDALDLGALLPKKRIITVGVDFDFIDVGPPPSRPVVLVVAHNNPLNVKGITDFLRFAWPLIKRAVPAAEFIIVGQVGSAIRSFDSQVTIRGIVDTLDPVYRDARVVVNPSVAGTGLKIKTVESVARFRPIVTWPHGVDGVHGPLLRLCHVARNWADFAARTSALLSGEIPAISQDGQAEIKRALQADVVYRELGAWLNESVLAQPVGSGP